MILRARFLWGMIALLAALCLFAYFLGRFAGGRRWQGNAAKSSLGRFADGSQGTASEKAQQTPKSWVFDHETNMSGYRCRYFKNRQAPDEGRAEIRDKDGKLLSDEEYDIENDYLPPPGSDVTGDHIPDRVRIDTYFIGFHSYYLYEIVPSWEQKNAFTFDSMRTPLVFEDLDHDGVYEATGEDWKLEYWWPGYSLSPHPRYILRFGEDDYRLALNLMKKPAPSAKELRRRLQEIRLEAAREGSGTYPHESASAPAIWKYMFDLIYEGNGKAARRFYEMLWAERRSFGKDPLLNDPANKKKFLNDFRNELTMSYFWTEIMDLNHWRSEDDF